jgi:hypothetical protein
MKDLFLKGQPIDKVMQIIKDQEQSFEFPRDN